MVLFSTLALVGCSRSATVPTMPTSVPTTTSSTATTTTTTLDPTAPAPPITEPTYAPPRVAPRATTAAGECVDPTDTEYCVWGTMPVELTVNNSRTATFTTNMRQSFTAVSGGIDSVSIEIGATGAGGFVAAPEGATGDESCMSMVLRTTTGISLARTHLVSTTLLGSIEKVDLPLRAGLIPGARYVLEVRTMPACVGRSLFAMVAMASEWKYPHDYGKLTIDGRPSVGSLWARIG